MLKCSLGSSKLSANFTNLSLSLFTSRLLRAIELCPFMTLWPMSNMLRAFVLRSDLLGHFYQLLSLKDQSSGLSRESMSSIDKRLDCKRFRWICFNFRLFSLKANNYDPNPWFTKKNTSCRLPNRNQTECFTFNLLVDWHQCIHLVKNIMKARLFFTHSSHFRFKRV